VDRGLHLREEAAVTGSHLLGFELLRPGLGLLLLATPVALFLGLFAMGARRRALLRLVAVRHLSRFVPEYAPARARLRVLLVTVAVAFLALACLGPVRGFTLREVQRRGLDIVICVDTSRSMLVKDIKPDRLGRAKREISLLLDRLTGDRVGLVAFAGDVRDVAPLTHDRETVRWFLHSLSPADNLMGGTDLGGALDHALELFDGRTGAHEAIVLLTDGEDLEGNGLVAAQAAGERGIRVYVVGMGSEDGGKVPDGNRGWVRDESGQEVISRLDGETLAAMAEAAGGVFLRADRSALPLEEIYDKRLSRLEGRELGGGVERIPHDRYQWPLVLAVIAMLAAAGISERRPSAAVPRWTSSAPSREEAA
jgi:Ca-activated chloride channel family protein